MNYKDNKSLLITERELKVLIKRREGMTFIYIDVNMLLSVHQMRFFFKGFRCTGKSIIISSTDWKRI